MAPVVYELKRAAGETGAVEPLVFLTGQHREMLDQVLALFGIEADADLEVMRPGQGLAELTARLMEGLGPLLERTAPDLVLVHGDTTTALTGALAAYYHQIPIGHVEAGLRTGNRYNPFPEEMNRQIVDRLAVHHFAPTRVAAAHLRDEGIAAEGIVVTGNTAIDALRLTLKRLEDLGRDELRGRHPSLFRILDRHREIVLVTSHRRENLGDGLEGICRALVDLTRIFPELAIIYPVHLNPQVRAAVAQLLAGRERIYLTAPLEYDVFCYLMAACRLILTDSGGIQEEAPSLDKPVLVLRGTSERPEAVEAGAVRIVGTDRTTIVESAVQLLTDEGVYRRMAEAVNPYGDGSAASRIVHHLLSRHRAPLLENRRP